MMSYAGVIPVFGVRQLESGQDVKNRLMTELSLAIKKVQTLSSRLGKEESLNEIFPETCYLCELLDRTLLFGLRELQWGYWPCIKSFVHGDSVRDIEASDDVTTSLGHGRRWLFESLNGFLLEGYVRSFMQNQSIIKKHYSQQSLLRDKQCLDVLSTMVAGLEYVPFALKENHPYLDDVHVWSRLSAKSLPLSRDSGVFCSSECLELSQAASSLTLSSMDTTFHDGDSGVVSLTNHTLMTSTATLTSLAEEVREEIVELDDTCNCTNCNSLYDGERIRQIIKLDVVPVDETDSELEVTRIVKRKKRRNTLDSTASRKSSQSALLDELASSSDCSDKTVSRTSTISTECLVAPLIVPHSSSSTEESRDTAVELEGNVEGVTQDTDDAEEVPGGIDSVEEVSIYDVYNLTRKNDETRDTFQGSSSDSAELAGAKPLLEEIQTSSEESLGSSSAMDVCSASTEKTESLRDEIDEMTAERQKGLDIMVENNTQLFLMLKIFEADGETVYKMFLAWKLFKQQRPEPVFILLSNKSLYALRPGSGTKKFEKEFSVSLTEISFINVLLNYQGFTLHALKGSKIEVSTGNAELTRSILSSLDIAIRRIHNGVNSLPCINANSLVQIGDLTKFFTKEFKVDADKITIKDYRLVHWETLASHEALGAPAGPSKSGFLMWRSLRNQSRKEKRKPWETGYFLLRAGILYRSLNSNDTIPSSTYLVSSSHCAGCQQVKEDSRPYTFQLNLEGTECLQLAASNENELHDWVQCFMLACEAPGYQSQNEGLAACCLILVGDLALTLIENKKILGRGGVTDLGHVYSESTYCILTFESGEADSCAADWVFWFSTETEKDDFLAVVATSWEELFRVPLNILPMVNNNLRNHCLERELELRVRQQNLIALCADS